MNSLPQEIQTQQLSGLPFYSQHLPAALELSEVLYKSGLLPQHFKNREQVLVALMWGQELGLAPIQAIHAIVVIQGTPTLRADTMKALISSRGGTITPVEWTEVICRLEMTRPGWKPAVYEYSMEDATKAGLSTKDNWKRMPRDMLFARAVSRGARNMWADVLKGIYSREEIEDQPIDVTPEKPVQIVTPPDPLPSKKAKTTEATREQKISALISAFGELGVSHDMLTETLGTYVEDASDEDLNRLREAYKQIKSGKKPLSEIFPVSPAEAPVQQEALL